MASTFGDFRQKQIPIIFTFWQTTNKQPMPYHLYKACKIKAEGRANFAILLVILASFHTLLLSIQSVP